MSPTELKALKSFLKDIDITDREQLINTLFGLLPDYDYDQIFAVYDKVVKEVTG